MAGIDLRFLRLAIIPTAILICVTVVLWQLHREGSATRTGRQSSVASATRAP